MHAFENACIQKKVPATLLGDILCKRGSSMPAGYARPSPEAGPHQAATTAPTHGASAKLERPRPAKGGANTQMSPSFANSGHWFHSTWSRALNNSAVECRVLWNQLPDLIKD